MTHLRVEAIKVPLNLLQLLLQTGYHFTVPGNLRQHVGSTLSHCHTFTPPPAQFAKGGQPLTSFWAFLRCVFRSEVILSSPANVFSLSST